LGKGLRNCEVCSGLGRIPQFLVDKFFRERREMKIPDTLLRKVLGETYGGPSISVENGKFVLYEWCDAPVGMKILAKGDTFEELMDDIKQKEGKLCRE
jgi:hypothetical protein